MKKNEIKHEVEFDWGNDKKTTFEVDLPEPFHAENRKMTFVIDRSASKFAKSFSKWFAVLTFLSLAVFYRVGAYENDFWSALFGTIILSAFLALIIAYSIKNFKK